MVSNLTYYINLDFNDLHGCGCAHSAKINIVSIAVTTAVSIAVVVTFILTLILYTPLLLLVVYCVYRCRGTNNTK